MSARKKTLPEPMDGADLLTMAVRIIDKHWPHNYHLMRHELELGFLGYSPSTVSVPHVRQMVPPPAPKKKLPRGKNKRRGSK